MGYDLENWKCLISTKNVLKYEKEKNDKKTKKTT